MNKDCFRDGKRVGMFDGVWPAAHALALPAGIVVAALLVGALLVSRRRSRVPGWLEPLVDALGAGLGDAVLVLDRRGRVVAANGPALRMAVMERDEILGRDVAVMGADVARLGAAVRGGVPVESRVVVPFGAAPVRAHAVAARLLAVPRLDVVVLRPERATVRVATPPPLPPRAPAADPGEAREAIGAVVASLKAPLSRAATAASYVRLLAPPLPTRAAEALSSLERALEDVGRRVGAIASSAERGRTPAQALDVGALVAELVAAFAPRPGVRLRVSIRPALALADDRPVRAAVREALRAVAGAAHGGDVEISVAARGGAAVIEIASGATLRDDDDAAAVARALVAPLGGRVEEEAMPGRGRSVRILLRGAGQPAL